MEELHTTGLMLDKKKTWKWYILDWKQTGWHRCSITSPLGSSVSHVKNVSALEKNCRTKSHVHKLWSKNPLLQVFLCFFLVKH